MVQVLEHLDRLLQDQVGLPTLDIDDETDPAGVVLEPWIVEPLLGRQARTPPWKSGGAVVFSLHAKLKRSAQKKGRAIQEETAL